MDAETLFLLTKVLTGAVTITATPGAPTTGTWFTGDLVLDSAGVLWVCEAGGTPGTWAQAASNWLTPISESANYAATNGQLVEATASLTVSSPANTAGNRFGAFADYAASNASPVTVTAVSGHFIGPGIPASTTSILLGAQSANIQFVSDGTNWIQTSGAQDSGWITPSLQNSWISAGNTPQYRLIGNTVRVRGTMESGASGTTAWTFPTGYRPTQQAIFQCILGSALTGTNNVLNILTSGVVDPAFSGSGPLVAFDCVTFTVD